jgi:hypothetical protein
MNVGGKPGYHRMPDGTMMKDSEHQGMNYGGKVKKMNKGGMCRGNGIAQRGQGRINLR